MTAVVVVPVYPRVGGGTVSAYFAISCAVGLSPRGRGNPRFRLGNLPNSGSIPAWAGEPRKVGHSRSQRPVYPRVGGGTVYRYSRGIPGEGLSPRGRGNRGNDRLSNLQLRSIPAWAGEPRGRSPCCAASWVYPRVGGGTRWWSRTRYDHTGLSPRGRGNLQYGGRWRLRSWSIPAWAGEPGSDAISVPETEVYPRVGGGTSSKLGSTTRPLGLSPRGRGNPAAWQSAGGSAGSIPAWAGEPPEDPGLCSFGTVYPRVGGGTGVGFDGRHPDAGLSPRGRGNHVALDLLDALVGVYPRVGGGTLGGTPVVIISRGLSPRGRGNQDVVAGADAHLRSIPAWAGEP